MDFKKKTADLKIKLAEKGPVYAFIVLAVIVGILFFMMLKSCNYD